MSDKIFVQMYSYDRKEHVEYLDKLIEDGSYQDYENKIYHLNQMRNIMREQAQITGVNHIQVVIDQSDGISWGDIIFVLDKSVEYDALPTVATECVAALNERGVQCNESALYFNRTMNGFLYTGVAVRAADAPDLYESGTRTFVVR